MSCCTHREGGTQLHRRGSGGGGRQVPGDGDGVRGQRQGLQGGRSIGLPAVLPVETQNLCREHGSDSECDELNTPVH